MSIVDLDPAAVPRAPDIQYIRGGFSLGRTTVPFYSTSVLAGDLASHLRLPSQIPFDPGRPIELEELFQRELNEPRVNEEIVPYLSTEGRLRFFNALTVVLLPLDPTNTQRLTREYPTDTGLAPSPSNAKLQATEIGPVLLSHPEEDASVGLLTWNTRLTLPVVLDGQHRFWAINQIINEPSGRLRDQLASSSVSVLFLVLDERAGFSAGGEMSVLEACREIFIDLNKHAQTVPKSRLYLLDDRDLMAVAMRSILAEGVDINGGSAPDRVHEMGRLPLALVDWRGDSAKFDSGPYVSSVLALHDVVQEVADIPTFPSDGYDEAREAVEIMEARLDLEDVAGFDRSAIRREIDAAEAEERPFLIPRDAIKAAGEAFRDRMGKRITEPLVGLAPYRELIESLSSAGILGTELEPWLSFNDRERRTLIAELGAEDPSAAVAAAWREVKTRRYPLAFQVVFQRAFISSLHSMVDQASDVWSHWGLEGAPDEEEFIAGWIRRFNESVAPALGTTGRESAFYGAGIRFDGTIDFRKSRARVITGFISYCMLAPIGDWVATARDGSVVPTESIEAWLDSRWAEIRRGRRPSPISSLFSTHGKNWRNSVDELVTARQEEESIDLDDQERERERLRHGAWQLRRVTEAIIATD